MEAATLALERVSQDFWISPRKKNHCLAEVVKRAPARQTRFPSS